MENWIFLLNVPTDKPYPQFLVMIFGKKGAANLWVFMLCPYALVVIID